ncbi:heme-binding protein 2-like [Corvus kubaryi]|uniref:heme-binding protein 2-like n=1 Tax=Corvus kubaryi TaxID=68294 RepID=UPI001C04295D|nr:heme-binding protein 2-like [Corvus kubaryi]XP_041903827.1 heme-binding protein 2-like [Corvus kubaryi]XP_041903828.1 heme-binding protein 2-like [Corvus kubaryi]XP_041903829.1 heme-binding protein 2-like [Corvus kubaryi]
METGGCRMGGAGPGGPAAITLEELDGLAEESADSAYHSHGSSLEEEAAERVDDEEQERLLSYWQSVGRGHQVDVPRDMAEPIQQLTRNNNPQERQSIPFTLIQRKEKLGDLLYEKRQYGKAKWACIKMKEKQYEQSICLGFMKLMRYICEQNSSGLYLGITVPIVTIVHTTEALSAMTQAVTVAYYLPEVLQDEPPHPFDSDIIIEEWPATIVYSRSFRGITNEDSIMREINLLAAILESPELCLRDTFIIAGYTNPAAANRHNEIWFLQRP